MKGRLPITGSDKPEVKKNSKIRKVKSEKKNRLITDIRGSICCRHSFSKLYANCGAAKLNVKVKFEL